MAKKPVNPNAQPEAAALLSKLYELKGKKMILGQHTQSMGQEELGYIEETTGELPALCGFELLAYSPNIPADADEECMTEVLADRGTLAKAWEWAEKGGILTFTWHWFSPTGGKDKSFYTINANTTADKIAVEGSEDRKAFMADMDYMAGLLRPFCDAHIPILWRPFHECEGDWFWWGKGEKSSVRLLYRLMYDRFVNHYHLDNLIWVFNSPLAECYPGDDVVDIITRDMYPPAHNHITAALELAVLKAITSSEKLYALAEMGTIPDCVEITKTEMDWSYFMTWSHDFAMTEQFTTKEFLQKVYSDPNCLTLRKWREASIT